MNTNAIIEMEAIGCLIGVMYIIAMFLAVATLWYAFTFIMWRIYRHNGGRHSYISYLRIKELEL